MQRLEMPDWESEKEEPKGTGTDLFHRQREVWGGGGGGFHRNAGI